MSNIVENNESKTTYNKPRKRAATENNTSLQCEENHLSATLILEGKLIKAVVDTGATYNFIKKEFAEGLKSNCVYARKEVEIFLANGSNTIISNAAELNITFGNVMSKCTFLVMPGFNEDIILGLDFLRAFNTTINCAGLSVNCKTKRRRTQSKDTTQPCTRKGLSEGGGKLDMPTQAESHNKHEQRNLCVPSEHTPQEEQRIQEFLQLELPKFKELTGVANNVKHKIVMSDARPFRLRYVVPNPEMQTIINKDVSKLLNCGYIEPSSSPYSSPIKLVSKEKNQTWRTSMDFEMLNRRSLRDAYPTPRMDGILKRLRYANYANGLQIQNAYFQIPMAEDSKKYTAFSVADHGLYQWRVMPYGLDSGPATLQRALDLAIGDMAPHAFAYLDNIFVTGKTLDLQLSNLKEIFCRLRAANIRINPDKCEFFKREIKNSDNRSSELQRKASTLSFRSSAPSPTRSERVNRDEEQRLLPSSSPLLQTANRPKEEETPVNEAFVQNTGPPSLASSISPLSSDSSPKTTLPTVISIKEEFTEECYFDQMDEFININQQTEKTELNYSEEKEEFTSINQQNEVRKPENATNGNVRQSYPDLESQNEFIRDCSNIKIETDNTDIQEIENIYNATIITDSTLPNIKIETDSAPSEESQQQESHSAPLSTPTISSSALPSNNPNPAANFPLSSSQNELIGLYTKDSLNEIAEFSQNLEKRIADMLKNRQPKKELRTRLLVDGKVYRILISRSGNVRVYFVSPRGSFLGNKEESRHANLRDNNFCDSSPSSDVAASIEERREEYFNTGNLQPKPSYERHSTISNCLSSTIAENISPKCTSINSVIAPQIASQLSSTPSPHSNATSIEITSTVLINATNPETPLQQQVIQRCLPSTIKFTQNSLDEKRLPTCELSPALQLVILDMINKRDPLKRSQLKVYVDDRPYSIVINRLGDVFVRLLAPQKTAIPSKEETSPVVVTTEVRNTVPADQQQQIEKILPPMIKFSSHNSLDDNKIPTSELPPVLQMIILDMIQRREPQMRLQKKTYIDDRPYRVVVNKLGEVFVRLLPPEQMAKQRGDNGLSSSILISTLPLIENVPNIAEFPVQTAQQQPIEQLLPDIIIFSQKSYPDRKISVSALTPAVQMFIANMLKNREPNTRSRRKMNVDNRLYHILINKLGDVIVRQEEKDVDGIADTITQPSTEPIKPLLTSLKFGNMLEQNIPLNDYPNPDSLNPLLRTELSPEVAQHTHDPNQGVRIELIGNHTNEKGEKISELSQSLRAIIEDLLRKKLPGTKVRKIIKDKEKQYRILISRAGGDIRVIAQPPITEQSSITTPAENTSVDSFCEASTLAQTSPFLLSPKVTSSAGNIKENGQINEFCTSNAEEKRVDYSNIQIQTVEQPRMEHLTSVSKSVDSHSTSRHVIASSLYTLASIQSSNPTPKERMFSHSPINLPINGECFSSKIQTTKQETRLSSLSTDSMQPSAESEKIEIHQHCKLSPPVEIISPKEQNADTLTTTLITTSSLSATMAMLPSSTPNKKSRKDLYDADEGIHASIQTKTQNQGVIYSPPTQETSDYAPSSYPHFDRSIISPGLQIIIEEILQKWQPGRRLKLRREVDGRLYQIYISGSRNVRVTPVPDKTCPDGMQTVPEPSSIRICHSLPASKSSPLVGAITTDAIEEYSEDIAAAKDHVDATDPPTKYTSDIPPGLQEIIDDVLKQRKPGGRTKTLRELNGRIYEILIRRNGNVVICDKSYKLDKIEEKKETKI